MLIHLRYAVAAGLTAGLVTAVVDAFALGARHPAWMEFAFLAYGLVIAAAMVGIALLSGAICRFFRYRPGPRTLTAFYLGLPLFTLAGVTGGEILRRVFIPAIFKGSPEVASVLGASLCGFVAGAMFVGLLVSAARREGRNSIGQSEGGGTGRGRAGEGPLRSAGIAVAALAVLSVLGLLVSEVSYGLREVPGRNLIIICVDALRPDHLSCYGYERTTSPNIDSLCGDGTRFDRAICQSPGSTASHASILTSLYPLTHGAWNVGDSLHEDVPSLQKHLRDRGYATAFFGNNYFLQPRFGFAKGFDSFGNEELAHRTKRAPLGLLTRSLGAARLFRAWRMEPGAPSEFSIDQSLSWIKKNRKRKFFLFLHIMDPHAPYSPPGEYRQMFFSRQYERELRDGRKLRGRIDFLESWEKEQLVDLYDGEVAYADSKAGRLTEALREWGLLDKTVVVITSDHGEVLAEHGAIFKHGYLWDSCIRVPLILRYPPGVPKGTVRTRTVQSIDIAPTALSLLGEPPLGNAQGSDLTGLLGADFDAEAGAGEGIAYTLGGITEGEGYSLTESRWKLAWLDDEHIELYDLLNDPGETTNLIEAEPELADDLKRRLLLWIKESGTAAVVPRSETVDPQRLDSEIQERLRTLGYIK